MDYQEIIDIEDLICTNTEYQNLKCPICHNIFNQPKACGNCLNHFCKNCIESWRLTKPDECPLCKHFVMNKPVPILINLLSKLKFNCPNKVIGCSDIISYEEYIKHSRLCPQKMVECTNIGCYDSFKQKELVLHEESCLYSMVNCIWCPRAIIRKNLKSHTSICPHRLQQCQHCSEQFRYLELQHHIECCPKKPMDCKWCKKQVIMQELEEHENICDMKQVNCLGCKNKMKLIEFYPHQNICGDYPVVCNRCNESIKRKDFKEHGIDKCVECLSKKHQQEVAILKLENSNLKERVVELETLEHNKKRKNSLNFSQILRDPDIFVNQNFAMVRQHKKKNRDRFLMIDSDPLQKTPVKWTIKTKVFRSEWFAIGISDQTNVYAIHRYQTLGHCSYLASANGTIYSTHNILSNHQRTDFIIQPNDQIQCSFDPGAPGVRPSLSIYNTTKDKVVVIDISPFELENRKYYPCVCFRFAGDTVEIIPNF